MQKYRNVKDLGGGSYEGEFAFDAASAAKGEWYGFRGSRNLIRIRTALDLDPKALGEIWAESDGYGAPGYAPAQGFDWSGIRDSSPAAKDRMEAIAKKYISDEALDRLLGLKGSAA